MIRRLAAVALLLLAAGCSSSPSPSPVSSASSSSSTAASSTAASSTSARSLISRSRKAGTWPGVSGVNGDPTLDAAHVEAFCTARGRPCGIAHTYTDRSSYTEMTIGTAWTFDNFATFPGALVVSQGLVPTGGESDMAGCATGAYDSSWRNFGTLMNATGRSDSIVRLGWEMNESTMPWRGTDPSVYISCFRHATSAIRATNPQVLIDWTINAHSTPGALCGGVSTNCYPGDAYVDIIGIDNYDHYPWSPTKAVFDRTANRPEGLNWLYAFAQSHKKPFSVGEWGVASGHDNANFITWMHAWFASHAAGLAYEAYFTNCDAGGVQSSLFDTSTGCERNPQAAARYRTLYLN